MDDRVGDGWTISHSDADLAITYWVILLKHMRNWRKVWEKLLITSYGPQRAGSLRCIKIKTRKHQRNTTTVHEISDLKKKSLLFDYRYKNQLNKIQSDFDTNSRHVAIPILLRIGYWYWVGIDQYQPIPIPSITSILTQYQSSILSIGIATCLTNSYYCISQFLLHLKLNCILAQRKILSHWAWLVPHSLTLHWIWTTSLWCSIADFDLTDRQKKLHDLPPLIQTLPYVLLNQQLFSETPYLARDWHELLLRNFMPSSTCLHQLSSEDFIHDRDILIFVADHTLSLCQIPEPTLVWLVCDSWHDPEPTLVWLVCDSWHDPEPTLVWLVCDSW
jgi:hypothetical protein